MPPRVRPGSDNRRARSRRAYGSGGERAPEGVDLGVEVREVAVVDDDVVGDARRSSSVAWAAIRASASASGRPRADQARDAESSAAPRPRRRRRTRPSCAGRGRRARRAAARRRPRRRASGAAAMQLGRSARHERVDDRLERGAALGVGEHDRRQGRAVERAVGGEHVAAELGRRRPRAPGCRARPPRARAVGVDDDGTVCGEPRRDRRSCPSRCPRSADPHARGNLARKNEARPALSGPWGLGRADLPTERHGRRWERMLRRR